MLDIPHQVFDDGYPLLSTAAGRCIDDDFMKTKAELQHQLNEIQTQAITARQVEGNKVLAEEPEGEDHEQTCFG